MSEPATREDLIKEATALVRKLGYARVGMVANDLHIGYVTSVRVIEEMQERGILAEYDAGRAYWPAIPAPQPCGHDARYIWPPDASDPDDEHQPTKYCLKCAFDALGDAMTASLRDANDLRNALNISGGREVDLQAEVKKLREDLHIAREHFVHSQATAHSWQPGHSGEMRQCGTYSCEAATATFEILKKEKEQASCLKT